MIMKQLFEGLWRHGTVTVMTSNIKPHDLYKEGLNREYFMSFIEYLDKMCKSVYIDTLTDYRYV